ncbi:MAG: hypothetical protein LBR21_11545 [Propionibacteriaceae bacterium]|jgi:hypothetical protein|nr:hypothetical protein [Propionibacteriaceae bacterium]
MSRYDPSRYDPRDFVPKGFGGYFCPYMAQKCAYADVFGTCLIGYCKVEDDDWTDDPTFFDDGDW